MTHGRGEKNENLRKSIDERFCHILMNFHDMNVNLVHDMNVKEFVNTV